MWHLDVIKGSLNTMDDLKWIKWSLSINGVSTFDSFSKTSWINHGQENANFPKMNFQSKIGCLRDIFWFMTFLFNLTFSLLIQAS